MQSVGPVNCTVKEASEEVPTCHQTPWVPRFLIGAITDGTPAGCAWGSCGLASADTWRSCERCAKSRSCGWLVGGMPQWIGCCKRVHHTHCCPRSLQVGSSWHRQSARLCVLHQNKNKGAALQETRAVAFDPVPTSSRDVLETAGMADGGGTEPHPSPANAGTANAARHACMHACSSGGPALTDQYRPTPGPCQGSNAATLLCSLIIATT